MSCYFRHLKEIFSEAGIAVTPDNRKQIDEAMHEIVAVTYKNCPVTWKKLKQEVLNNTQRRVDFVNRLREAVK